MTRYLKAAEENADATIIDDAEGCLPNFRAVVWLVVSVDDEEWDCERQGRKKMSHERFTRDGKCDSIVSGRGKTESVGERNERALT